MRTKMEQQTTYEGSIDNMPTWAKNVVMPRWRRFLIHPLTIYLTVISGVGLWINTTNWYYMWLNTPSLFLVMQLATVTYRMQWFKACIKAEKEQAKSEPIPSPFVKM